MAAVDAWAAELMPLAQQSNDAGVRGVSALSARLAYAFTCLSLCWGVLTATGWVRNISGRSALRAGHLALAVLALSFGLAHAACFLFLSNGALSPAYLAVPLLPGSLARHALGIIGLELMLAVALTAAVRRFTSYRRWLWLHRLAYPAVGLIALHSLLGAIANGHLAVLWLGGITLLVPTATLAALRILPIAALERIGLVEEDV